MAFSEAKYSLSILAEGSISLNKSLIPFFINRYNFSSNIDKGASRPDSFWRALHEDAVVRVFLFVVVDGEGVFVVGVEGKAAFLALLIPYNWVFFSKGVDVLNRLEELDESCLRGVSSGRHIKVEHMLQAFLPLNL